jgi:hypothetical protein
VSSPGLARLSYVLLAECSATALRHQPIRGYKTCFGGDLYQLTYDNIGVFLMTDLSRLGSVYFGYL